MRVLVVFICFAIVFCVFPSSALSRVTVYDMVVIEGQKVMLRAETRGKLFNKGGELVEFLVDGKSIGKTLSGGDGVAFKQFTSVRTGLRQISARSDKDEDTGLLLSLERGSSIVFVDVEGSLLEGLFSWKPKHGSRKAIEEIQKGFSIVYLQTSVVGVGAVKAWIEENEFPKSPVVPWRHGAIFNEIVKKGLRIKAVIAGPKVIESAEEYEPLAFSFEASEDAEKVKDWDEIRRKFRKVSRSCMSFAKGLGHVPIMGGISGTRHYERGDQNRFTVFVLKTKGIVMIGRQIADSNQQKRIYCPTLLKKVNNKI